MTMTEPDAAELIAAIDWTGVTHIIDIGGNRGALLGAILRHLPSTTGVLFDQPHAVASAGETLDSLGVADRVDVAAGDLCDAVPPGGDLYLVANVLWNVTDEQALQLLRRCREAMAAAARLVVCEPVTRSVDDWRALLDRAGFALSNVCYVGAEWGVIEAKVSRRDASGPTSGSGRR